MFKEEFETMLEIEEGKIKSLLLDIAIQNSSLMLLKGLITRELK
jgi:hypothetical protein